MDSKPPLRAGRSAPLSSSSPRTDASPGLGGRARRLAWLTVGLLSLSLGMLGVFLPLLPTVPFVLLAAWCFSRGCTRCERWLLEHPRLGPPLREWRARRAVPRRVKWLATASTAGGAALSAWLLDGWLGVLPAMVCAAVAMWLWSLPEPVRR